jgi:TonB family protein
MSRIRAWLLVVPFATTFGVCQAQTVVPNSLPELNYPPIARAAHVQGDVVVSFRQTPEGRTVDVTPVSGPAMLQGIAVENVKAWHFEPKPELAGQAYKVTFHFQLNPLDDGYDNSQPVTKAVLDGTGQVQVISISTTGLDRSECPTVSDLVPPAAVIDGDFEELQRWNEEVRVGADGSVVWKQGDLSQRGQITPAEANSLLERFRTPAVWRLCGRYDQAGLLDGDGSSFLRCVSVGRKKASVNMVMPRRPSSGTWNKLLTHPLIRISGDMVIQAPKVSQRSPSNICSSQARQSLWMRRIAETRKLSKPH